jgi:outer membrane protein TolC
MFYFDNTLSHTEYYFDDKSKDSGFLVETQNIATLNLSWNVLDFGTIEKNYEAKYYEYMSKKSTLEYEKHKATVAHRLAKKSLEIAMLKIDSAKATLDAARATYELVKIRYQNGVVDNVAYLQALSEMVDAKRGYERALYDVEVKKAELIYHSGKDIKEYL